MSSGESFSPPRARWRQQNKLAQLNRLELRQAKADIVYLMAVLNGESGSVAQEKAQECWRVNEEHAQVRKDAAREGSGSV